MRRKVYNQLKKWKEEQNGESAVLINGARRVGKSYIVFYLHILNSTKIFWQYCHFFSVNEKAVPLKICLNWGDNSFFY